MILRDRMNFRVAGSAVMLLLVATLIGLPTALGADGSEPKRAVSLDGAQTIQEEADRQTKALDRGIQIESARQRLSDIGFEDTLIEALLSDREKAKAANQALQKILRLNDARTADESDALSTLPKPLEHISTDLGPFASAFAIVGIVRFNKGEFKTPDPTARVVNEETIVWTLAARRDLSPDELRQLFDRKGLSIAQLEQVMKSDSLRRDFHYRVEFSATDDDKPVNGNEVVRTYSLYVNWNRDALRERDKIQVWTHLGPEGTHGLLKSRASRAVFRAPQLGADSEDTLRGRQSGNVSPTDAARHGRSEPSYKTTGIVMQVSRESNRFTEISLGADDGIKVGQGLDVFRDNKVVASIVVRQVKKDLAIAESLTDLKRELIRQGDRVGVPWPAEDRAEETGSR